MVRADILNSIPKDEQGKNKPLSRRTFLRLIGSGLAAVVLAGCGPDPEPPTNKPTDVPAAAPATQESPPKKEISQEQLYHMALRKEAISELVAVDSKQYVYTQFAPFYANRVFVFFDKLEIKSKMQLSIICSSDCNILLSKEYPILDLYFI